ncbi:MAG TPA: hypothetical protein VGQ39_23985 [Pyrinomonadaceae bacterium]|nr:hypothetical protein [Pyrinomonadaceae bacterium]
MKMLSILKREPQRVSVGKQFRRALRLSVARVLSLLMGNTRDNFAAVGALQFS